MTSYDIYDGGIHPTMAGKIISLVVGVLIVSILGGALLPVAAAQFNSLASNGNLSTAEQAIAGVMFTFVLVAVVLGVLKLGGFKFSKM